MITEAVSNGRVIHRHCNHSITAAISQSYKPHSQAHSTHTLRFLQSWSLLKSPTEKCPVLFALSK